MSKLKSPYKETKCYFWEWVAVYDRYEKVWIPRYCESCGQEDGGDFEERGVNIIRYDLKKFKKDSLWYAAQALNKVMMPLIVKNIESIGWAGKVLALGNYSKSPRKELDQLH